MKKMRAYYGSRFSPNMTETPDGFLICHNVPIARTGYYEYLGEEIGADDKRGQIVKVFRSPEEVFSEAAIASFEGKVLTDEHPPGGSVTPDNATRHSRGVVQNVRQGKGEDSDLLLADLVIHDESLIREIQQGKREVSAGYDCTYVKSEEGTFSQTQICGNHVAVVKKGRAGNRVAIKDSISESKKGVIKMPKGKMTKGLLAALGLKQLFTADAEPEELEEALNAYWEENGQRRSAKDEDPTAPPAAPAQDPVLSLLTEIKNELAKLNSGKPAADEEKKPEDMIDEAISELEKKPTEDDDEEESHTVPAESMQDEELEDGPVSSPEDRPKDPITGDNAYKIAALRAMKPIIAAIPDPAQRKKAADAAIASIKGKPAENTYGKLAKPRKPAADAKPADLAQLGREIAKKYNPHYKDRA